MRFIWAWDSRVSGGRLAIDLRGSKVSGARLAPDALLLHGLLPPRPSGKGMYGIAPLPLLAPQKDEGGSDFATDLRKSGF